MEFRQLLSNHEQIKLAHFLDASIKATSVDQETFSSLIMQNQTGKRDDSSDQFARSSVDSIMTSEEKMYMTMPKDLIVSELIKLK